MKHGYTICDAANQEVYLESVEFIVRELGYQPLDDELQDVDGSIWRSFVKGNCKLVLESNAQIDYVGIVSEVELPIECLHKWKR